MGFLWLTADVVHPLSLHFYVSSPHTFTTSIFFILLPGVRTTGLKTRVKKQLRSFHFILYSAESLSNASLDTYPLLDTNFYSFFFFLFVVSPLMGPWTWKFFQLQTQYHQEISSLLVLLQSVWQTTFWFFSFMSRLKINRFAFVKLHAH